MPRSAGCDPRKGRTRIAIWCLSRRLTPAKPQRQRKRLQPLVRLRLNRSRQRHPAAKTAAEVLVQAARAGTDRAVAVRDSEFAPLGRGVLLRLRVGRPGEVGAEWLFLIAEKGACLVAHDAASNSTCSSASLP